MDRDVFYYPPPYIRVGKYLARYFVILNSSVNFLIYCLSWSQFRTDMRSAFPGIYNNNNNNNNNNVVMVNHENQEMQEESAL